MEDGRKAVKGDAMIGQIEEKKQHESEVLLSQKKVMCPVCGEEINEDNLPEVKGVIEDNLYYLGGVVIVSSSVQLLVDCWHELTSGGITLDDQHPLTAVIACRFDGEGKCVHFEVTEIRGR